MQAAALVFALLLPTCIAAQAIELEKIENRIDSLDGVEKAIAYYRLVSSNVGGDLDKAGKYLMKAKQFATGSGDQMVQCYTNLAQGLYFSRTGKLDSAMLAYVKANEIAKVNNDIRAQILTHGSIGRNSIASGNAEKGLTHLFEALRLIDLEPDHGLMLRTRVNIMWAYLEMKSYRDCIDYARSSLKLIAPGDEWIAVYIYNNVAVCYDHLKQLDSAEYFAKKSIQIAAVGDDFEALANAHFILGSIYSSSGRYNKAIAEYVRARPYREKAGNPFFVVSDLYTISELYNKTGQFEKGVAAGLEGLAIAEKFNMLLKFEGVYHSLANLSYFSKVFKEEYGVLPSEYPEKN